MTAPGEGADGANVVTDITPTRNVTIAITPTEATR